VAVTATRSLPPQRDKDLRLMMLGYGVGLSWGAAVVNLEASAVLLHRDYGNVFPRGASAAP
jgi:3-oxoacyl-[acyl-carrier-protein] synthase-3